MRVILEPQAPADEWLDDADANLVGLATRGLNHEVIFQSTRSRNEFGKDLLRLKNERAKELLSQTIRSSAWIHSKAKPEFMIGDFVSEENLVSLRNRPAYNLALASHTQGVTDGEQPEESYRRLFGHILPSAKLLEITDPYVSMNLMRQDLDKLFFLRRTLSISSADLTIYTREPRDETRLLPKKLELIEKCLRSLLAEAHSYKGKMRILFGSTYDTKDLHDRRMRILMDEGSIYVEMSKGVTLFMEPSREGYEFNCSLDQRAFDMGRRAWRESRSVGSFELSHTDVCTACSE